MIEKTVVTIITKNYLSHARTLAKTLNEKNPNSQLFVLLADRVDGYFDPAQEPFKLIELSALSEREPLEKMCFYYTAFELCCALRGMLHEYILNNTSVRSWIFLDSDIMVCNSLEEIFQEMEKTSILLTPHATIPVELEDVEPHEINFLRAGLYNAGFLGIRRTDTSKKFIYWFKERLSIFCFNETYSKMRGLFVDQLWLNLVPLYFKEVNLYLNPGANLGHWNLLERHLETDASGQLTVNGKHILFVHFSGWDIENPGIISNYALQRDDNRNQAGWEKLAKTYREKLLANGYEECRRFPYAFNYFDNGEAIAPFMRIMYYEQLKTGIVCEGSPFANHFHFQEKKEPLVKRIGRRMKKTIAKLLE